MACVMQGTEGKDDFLRIISPPTGMPVLDIDALIMVFTLSLFFSSAQAVKRSLCVLPYSPQSLSDSPYLDQALFSYDEKVISASDR